MKALVIFESMYGNTRDVADAIGEGLRSSTWEVDVVEVGDAPTLISSGVDLLIVGGPTHQFGLSRPSSRQSAANGATTPIVSRTSGVREWMDKAEIGHLGIASAAFDTLLLTPRFLRYFGRASRKIDKRLARLGCHPVVSPESFWVTGGKGPLADGEVDRAHTWGQHLGTRVSIPELERQSML
jgi:hypothetical protein